MLSEMPKNERHILNELAARTTACVCGSDGESAVKTVYHAWNRGQLLTAILFRTAECGQKPSKKTSNSQISGKIREKTSYFG